MNRRARRIRGWQVMDKWGGPGEYTGIVHRPLIVAEVESNPTSVVQKWNEAEGWDRFWVTRRTERVWI